MGVAIAAGVVLAACGSSPSSSSPAGGGHYLSVSSAGKSVTLTLNMTGFNFDGFSNGQMTVTVPRGWSVTVHCHNDTTLPHTCAIVRNTSSTSPAFAGAATSDPTAGLQPNTSGSFTFTASSAGRFLIGCLVPGHMPAGMWDHFDVIDSGSPSIST